MMELKNEIVNAARAELNRANKKYPLFASQHEGYAVVLEEIDEATEDFNAIQFIKDRAWIEIKHNIDASSTMVELERAAIKLACEAVQVAAMAIKFRRSEIEEEIT